MSFSVLPIAWSVCVTQAPHQVTIVTSSVSVRVFLPQHIGHERGLSLYRQQQAVYKRMIKDGAPTKTIIFTYYLF